MTIKQFAGGWRKRPKEATPGKALQLFKQGLKLKEIAKLWDISEQAVHGLIARAKISQMTPEQKQLSRALDCQEWLRQYIQTKYEGKIFRRLNLYLREIRSVLEKEIPLCPTNGSESAEKNPVPAATMIIGVQSGQTTKSPAA